MKAHRLLFALTALNVVLLAFSLAQSGTLAMAQGAPPVLRGRALEIVDDGGRVRASIAILPADPNVRMPDGPTGYPETVLLRLVNSKGVRKSRSRPPRPDRGRCSAATPIRPTFSCWRKVPAPR